MRIMEVAGSGSDSQSGRLAALAQFLTGRADDEAVAKKISVTAFLKLAQNMGISITEDQLRDLAQQAPLNSLIASVENNEVLFRGNEEVDNTQMSVDQARQTVDTMAKRAAKKSIQ